MIIYSSSAGSGKTFTLVKEYLKMIIFGLTIITIIDSVDEKLTPEEYETIRNKGIIGFSALYFLT